MVPAPCVGATFTLSLLKKLEMQLSCLRQMRAHSQMALTDVQLRFYCTNGGVRGPAVVEELCTQLP